jgi:hypothetical protein
MALGGKNTDWRHGTNGAVAVLTDFTAKTISVSPSWEAEQVESTTFGDTYREFEQSFKSGTIEVEYKSDDTIFGQLAAIYNNGDSVSFQYSPDGTASGKPKVTGSMIMTSFSPPASIGEILTISVSWQISGATTFTTHS